MNRPGTERIPMHRIVFGALVVLALVGPSGSLVSAMEQEHARLYLTADKSQLVVLPGEPFTKVSIANPAVADVNVITPTQLLLNGKAVGATSLILFYPGRIRSFDLVVTPAPVVVTGAPVVAAEPHAVLVHRAGRVSEQLFARDKEQTWLELGTVKLEAADAAKK
jgi:Flp pilus assembly secretin CpaC